MSSLVRAFAVAVALAMTGCSAEKAGTPATEVGTVNVTDATLRPAGEMAMISFTLQSDRDDTLLEAEAGPLGRAMLHRSTIDSGVARMRAVDSIEIPAGKSVRLADKGFHLMVAAPNPPLGTGSMVPVTLRFAKAKPTTIEARVLDLASSDAGAMAMDGMKH